MPERPQTSSFCKCSQCLEESSDPRGKRIETSKYAAHLGRVQNAIRRSRKAAVEEQPASNLASTVPVRIQPEDADFLTAELFGSTFADEGPHRPNEPNKLWTSRSELQAESSQRHGPPQAPDFSDISETVVRLGGLEISTSDALPPNLHRTFPEPRDLQRATKRLVPALEALALGDAPTDPAVQKQENSILNSTALDILSAIRNEILICRAVIMKEITLDDLKQTEIVVHRLTLSLTQITRKTPSVKTLKAVVMKELAELSQHVADKRVLQPEPTNVPVSFVSGMTFYGPCLFTSLTF